VFVTPSQNPSERFLARAWPNDIIVLALELRFFSRVYSDSFMFASKLPFSAVLRFGTLLNSRPKSLKGCAV